MTKKKEKKVKDPRIDDSKVFCAVCGCPHEVDTKCVQCRGSWPSQE